MDKLTFTPQSKSYLVVADVAAPAGVQVPVLDATPGAYGAHYRIHNTGSVVVHIGVGDDATKAQNNAVAPTAGTPQPSIAIAPGSVEILTFKKGAFFSGIASATANIFIVAGEGI